MYKKILVSITVLLALLYLSSISNAGFHFGIIDAIKQKGEELKDKVEDKRENDGVPTIQFTSTSSNGNEATTPANLQLTLSAAFSQNVTVNFTVTGGTATGGDVDYTLAAGTVTIPAGQTTANISAVIRDDPLDEPDETIIVTISDPINATLGANTVHTYTINDNDGVPGVINLPKTGQTNSYDANAPQRDDGALERGVAWPNPRFTDHGNGTVTDNLTGLMWTENANLPGGTRTWQGALDYVAGMNAGTNPNFGHTDWRLPNINELESLIHVGKDNAAYLNDQGFTNVDGDYYWSSSTSYSYYTGVAWIVGMRNGYVYDIDRSVNSYVWPVRAGQ